MPQMNGYIKYFNDGGRNMSFIGDDKDVYAIRDDKYVCCKLNIFGGVVWSIFSDNVVPMEKQCYLCIAASDVDSVLKVGKKVYPQAYLEQCKYKLKKRKPIDFIDTDIIDDSESDDE